MRVRPTLVEPSFDQVLDSEPDEINRQIEEEMNRADESRSDRLPPIDSGFNSSVDVRAMADLAPEKSDEPESQLQNEPVSNSLDLIKLPNQLASPAQRVPKLVIGLPSSPQDEVHMRTNTGDLSVQVSIQDKIAKTEQQSEHDRAASKRESEYASNEAGLDSKLGVVRHQNLISVQQQEQSEDTPAAANPPGKPQ